METRLPTSPLGALAIRPIADAMRGVAEDRVMLRALRRSSGVMNIDVRTSVSSTEWNRLIVEDDCATFFHRAEWARLIETTVPGWKPLYIAATHRGRLVAAIPLMVRQRRGALLAASMPFGTYGGVLINGDAPLSITRRLAYRFFDIVRSSRVAHGELVDFSRRLLLPNSPQIAQASNEVHVLSLEPGYEALWRRFKQPTRNKVRKARRAGVAIRRARSVRDFRAYHRMLVACCRRWGRREYLGADFFVGLSKLDPDHVHMWLAEHDGKVIAGLLNFAWRDTVFSWGNVSLSRDWCYAANNLLHTEVIADAVRRGARVYNFGANPGLPGVDAFKASFGTDRVRYDCYRAEKTWYRIVREVRTNIAADFSQALRQSELAYLWM